MPWTEAQQAAIGARGEDLLVSAAAGSGKTAVMVERVLRLIQEGVSIDEMLIVTFTRAAASDMRRKFHERLAEAAKTDPRMREQLSLLETAEISTLHSFCSSLLRDHFEKAEIAPDFHVVSGNELKVIDDAVLDEVMEDTFTSGDPDAEALNYGRGPDAVRDLVLSLADYLTGRPDPAAWLEEVLARDLTGDYRRLILYEANRKRLEAISYFRTALSLCHAPGGPYYAADVLENDILSVSDEITELGVYEVTYQRMGRRKKDDVIDEDLVARMSKLREDGKACIKKAKELIAPDIGQIQTDTEASKRDLRLLGRMALRVNELRAEAKAEKHVLTFDDLEMQALRCLRDDDICALVREKYKCVFVDEYQDTSDIQNSILNRVARPGTLFMVGDVKQSIYRFRSAEPRLFLEKYEKYARREGGRMIALSTNFRSRPRILSFVNRVFEKVMTGGDTEILYDEDARLNPGGKFENEDPEICVRVIQSDGTLLPDEPDDSPEAGEIADMTDIEREGALAASMIAELRKNDPSLRYSDIAILARKTADLASVYAALTAAGIPAYIDADGGYYDSYEVSLMMAMLRVISNPCSDCEWIMIMRSAIGGFTTEELAEIRVGCPEGSFYNAVIRAAEEKSALGEKTADFLRMIDGFVTLAPALPVSGLIDRILTETGMGVYLANLPGSTIRRKNLSMLMEKADKFESVYMDGLTGFLRLTQRERSDNDAGSAHELSEADDVVRLMTVHKSKGLEFRAVFGIGLGKDMSKKPQSRMPLIDRYYGIGMPYIDREQGVRRKTMPQIVMEKKTALMDMAEELRILYVMLTRPKDYLYLIGTVKGDSAALRWELAHNGAAVYKSYLDIIMGAVDANDADIDTIPAAGIPSYTAVSDTGTEGTLRLLTEAREHPITSGELYDRVYAGYAHADAAYLPTKLTASGLERLLEGPCATVIPAAEPNFLTGRRSGGTARGTAYHHALYAMPLQKISGLTGRELLAAVKTELRGMTEDRKLRSEEYDLIRPEYIARLYESELGRRMLASPAVKREWRFNVIMSANEALETDAYPAEEQIVVQGSIDLAFFENGAWVLVDYKTDREEDTEEILNRHRQQLRLYAGAIERITGQKVKEKYLWLVARSEALPADEREPLPV